jgi:hypothetical protein
MSADPDLEHAAAVGAYLSPLRLDSGAREQIGI